MADPTISEALLQVANERARLADALVEIQATAEMYADGAPDAGLGREWARIEQIAVDALASVKESSRG